MQDTMIGQNIIITEPSRNLRALGRNALKGKWKIAIIAAIIYMLVINIPPVVFDSFFGVNTGSIVMNNGNTFGMGADMYINVYNSMPEYSFFSILYILLISGAMELGISIFFLALFRNHKVGAGDVFLGFEKFGKALLLILFRTLFIFLWMCLFIVPGIIAAIRYSQAFYILADDPSKGIRQCMNESKAMMKGNKMKYFCLSLSFIGWAIVAAIPAGMVTGMVQVVSSSEIVIGIFTVLSNLFLTPVYAYVYSTTTGFYEILAGHLIKETQPAPVSVMSQDNVLIAETVTEVPQEAVEEKIESTEVPEVTETTEESEVIDDIDDEK